MKTQTMAWTRVNIVSFCYPPHIFTSVLNI